MRPRKLTSMVAALVVVGLSVMLVIPLTRGQGDTLSETFDDPTLPGWELGPGAEAVSGVLRVPAPSFGFWNVIRGDLTLALRARLIGEGELVIGYFASDTGMYQLALHPTFARLTREANGVAQEIVAVPTAIQLDDWVQIEIKIVGGEHFISFNGQPLLTGSDANPLPPGGIFLHARGAATSEFDDLVLATSDTPTSPVEPAPVPDVSSISTDALTWIRTGGPPGGLGYDIRYNFANPDIWYVTDNFAGVHISTDNGYTWQPSNTGIPPQSGPTGDALPIFSLTVDPHDPQIIWAGTNETGHIYKSTDGGYTWQQKDQGITIDYDGGLSFRGFTVDPRTSDIVYAMAETADPITGYAVWGSGTGGAVFKTIDGGENWTKIWDGGMPSSLARYMWIDPRNPDVLYVSTGIFDRGAIGEGNPETDPDPFGGLGILKSTDGGQSWRILGEENGLGMLYIGSLYMHPDNPDVLLAAAGHVMPAPAAEWMIPSGHGPAGIYRTDDGGETWTHVLESSPDRIGEAFSSVEICPSNPNIVYAGSEATIYRSHDAGLTWAVVSGGTEGWGPSGVITGWPIDMQCDPRDPERIFANNYGGGNFLSEDGGRTWQNASNGYTGATVTEVTVDPQDPARVYAVSNSGVWLSEDAGLTWAGMRYATNDFMASGAWTAVEFDPVQPGRVLAGNPPWLVESLRSGPGWQPNWPEQMPNGEPVIALTTAIVDIAFAPSDSNRVYAGLGQPGCQGMHEPCAIGTGGLIMSLDRGTTWSLAEDSLIRDMPVFNLAVDPFDANMVFAATEIGLLTSADGGLTWAVVNGQPGESRVRAVAVSPTNPPRVLAGVDGLGVYVSDDGGQTWQAGITGLEPNGSLHDLVVDPTNPQIIYASDYFSGVYRSSDGGLIWKRINNGLQNRAALGLAISADGQHIYVGTNGAGVFRLGTP